MRRSNSEHISEILQRFLREEGLETPLNQHRLINSWSEVMGQGIMKYTGDIFIKNQTLYVQIRSSVLKQDLMMSRQALVKRLNEHINAQVITDTNRENLDRILEKSQGDFKIFTVKGGEIREK